MSWKFYWKSFKSPKQKCYTFSQITGLLNISMNHCLSFCTDCRKFESVNNITRACTFVFIWVVSLPMLTSQHCGWGRTLVQFNLLKEHLMRYQRLRLVRHYNWPYSWEVSHIPMASSFVWLKISLSLSKVTHHAHVPGCLQCLYPCLYPCKQLWCLVSLLWLGSSHLR